MDDTWVSTPAFRCRRAPTTAEWDAVRPTFTDLYRLQNRRLVDVMKTLQDQHGFHATTKMYKSKIAAWGLDKNVKSHDAQRLLRIKQRYDAAGQPCVLLHKGFLIDVAAVERRCKRARLKRGTPPARDDNILDLFESQCVPLPCNFSTINDPDSFSLIQCLLHNAAVVLECFSAQHSSNADELWIDNYGGPNTFLIEIINQSIQYFIDSDYVTGGKHLRKGFRLLPELLEPEDDTYFLDLDYLLYYFAVWGNVGFGDVSNLVLRHLVSLSEIYVPPTHLCRTILRILLQLTETQWELAAFIKIYRALARASKVKFLPRTHAEVIWSDLLDLEADVLLDAHAYLAWVEETCGAESDRFKRATDFCVHKAKDRHDWDRIEMLLLQYQYHGPLKLARFRHAIQLAYSQTMLQKYSSTMDSLQRALDCFRSTDCDISQVVLQCAYWHELLPWLKSLSSEHNAVIEFHALQKEYDDELERRDQEERQDTMLAMQALGFDC